MGGKNHQPTRQRITAVSAWLSQRIGEGVALVQTSNNHLEDAIMLGMGKLHVQDLVPSLSGTPTEHLLKAIDALGRSQVTLTQIQVGFGRLSDVARIESYSGNPLASQLKSYDLRSKFEGALVRPFANIGIWEELEERITTDNILKTLEWERSQFEMLNQPTFDLIAVMEDCRRISEQEGGHTFVDAVEHNRLPLRQYFAQVFSLWNHLDAMFLYSALMMTELFYRANSFPSLLDFEPAQISSNAA
ncbi:MAG: hypothetical protein ACREXM_01685 [Gammaproteobacteria bacterium]